MYDLVIRGGAVATAGGVLYTDIAVLGEKIAALGVGIDGREVIDATGKIVLPGVIDPHVHFALPVGDYVSSDDFYSGSVAAACGGVTTVIDFTVGASDRSIPEDVERRLEDAKPSVVDYALHGEVVGWRPGRVDEIAEAVSMGVASFKFFTAYGASGRRTDNGPLLQAFRAIAGMNAVAVVHAEDDSIIESMSALLTNDEWGRMESLARVRPDVCEASAVNTVGWLSALTGAKCHIVHLSSELGLEEVMYARDRGADLTAETCPQYLLLTSDAYSGPEGHLYSAAPALRGAGDNAALWTGLSTGDVDFAATDHCPFTRTQKEWKGAFDRLPGGLPGVELLLPLLYSEGVRSGRLSLCDLARITSDRAARRYGLFPRKGCLMPGSDADIVVFDPEEVWCVHAGGLRMNVDFSPYENMKLTGRTWLTISRGEIVFSEDRFLGKKGRGVFLRR
jgi:dihydropyrimidinase